MIIVYFISRWQNAAKQYAVILKLLMVKNTNTSKNKETQSVLRVSEVRPLKITVSQIPESQREETQRSR